MSTRKGYYPIYIYDEDMRKLMSIVTWNKFKKWSYADIIKWILENDIICEEIHKNIKVNKK